MKKFEHIDTKIVDRLNSFVKTNILVAEISTTQKVKLLQRSNDAPSQDELFTKDDHHNNKEQNQSQDNKIPYTGKHYHFQ